LAAAKFNGHKSKSTKIQRTNVRHRTGCPAGEYFTALVVRRVAKLSSIACGSGGVEISDGLDPVLALATVAEPHSMAHPNRCVP